MKFILFRRCFTVRKSGSYMCKKSAKTDQAKIREILAPHLWQRGPGKRKIGKRLLDGHHFFEDKR